jgi:hypothetical protein
MPAPMIAGVTPGTEASPVVFCPSRSVTNGTIEVTGRPDSIAAFPTLSPIFRVTDTKMELSEEMEKMLDIRSQTSLSRKSFLTYCNTNSAAEGTDADDQAAGNGNELRWSGQLGDGDKCHESHSEAPTKENRVAPDLR